MPLITRFTTSVIPNTDLSSVPSFDIYNTFGKISFQSPVALVRNLPTYKGQLDVDSNLTIAPGLVSLNSTPLDGLNRPARITLYGITTPNPVILRDGNPCPQCRVISHTGTTLVIFVPSFSTYTIAPESTPTVTTTSGRTGSSRRGIFTPNLLAALPTDPGCVGGNLFSTVTGKRCATTTPTSTFKFTKSLSFGMIDPEVQELQKYLNNNGFPVTLSGVGSLGYENKRFGPATRAALARFQAAKGIKPSVGFFGPLTRGYVVGK
jgi:hypothetical protein